MPKNSFEIGWWHFEWIENGEICSIGEHSISISYNCQEEKKASFVFSKWSRIFLPATEVVVNFSPHHPSFSLGCGEPVLWSFHFGCVSLNVMRPLWNCTSIVLGNFASEISSVFWRFWAPGPSKVQNLSLTNQNVDLCVICIVFEMLGAVQLCLSQW